MTLIARLRGEYLSEKLSPSVLLRLEKIILPAHLLAYSGVLSLRVINRKIGHAAPFDHLTWHIMPRWFLPEWPDLELWFHLGRCAVDQRNLNFREEVI
jgi:hypothetical protein